MNRRNFLRQIGGYLAATSATCATCQPAFSWLNNFPGARLVGCTLTGTFNSGAHGMRFSPTSGNPHFDQIIFREANILAQITGLQPSLAFLDDRNAPNAFASAQDIVGWRSPHGAVVLGVNGVNQVMLAGGGDITAALSILVHEWAHIGQFATGIQSRSNTVAPTELMADFIAGWYHGFRCTQVICQTDPRFAESGLASVGDYNTQNKQHHGTPRQRAQAYRDGYLFVRSGGGGGLYGFQSFAGQSFGNPYGNGYGGGGGFNNSLQFLQAFNFARRKYVG